MSTDSHFKGGVVIGGWSVDLLKVGFGIAVLAAGFLSMLSSS